MRVLLVSKTAIINQIFKLVCSKLNFELLISDNTKIDESFDFIIIDETFIDDGFNFIRKHAVRLGAIVKEELPFDKSRDFIIKRPFLPTQLEKVFKDELESIRSEKEMQTQQLLQEKKPVNDENTDDEVFAYVESLADDIVIGIEDDSDESIVTLASLHDGGVLDSNELSKINTILDEPRGTTDIHMDEDDWKDLSEIIDEALDEVQDYEFDMPSDNVINLILSNYSIDELRPLLKKFDQSVIDKLSSGQSIDLRLSLKADK